MSEKFKDWIWQGYGATNVIEEILNNPRYNPVAMDAKGYSFMGYKPCR